MSQNAYDVAHSYIFPEVIKALRKQNPTADAVSVQLSAENITKEVVPVLVNQTNNEPWYQSRVIIGSLVAIGGGILQLYGYTVSANDMAMIVELVGQATTFGGSLVALYGRLAARKPL